MIELTDEMRTRLASALTDGYPVVAATVDADGQPKLSFFGSTHVHSDDQLAFWVRDPEGGTLRRLAENPRISFLYRHPAEKVRWVFEGRARRVDEADERARVYDESAELERLMDAERKGVAVVVDLDAVTGRGVEMRRDG
jgi:predicted pyridoxine 5'-phosphate oxidase superfamily flavin-nucleotide-binding protein